MIEKDDNIPDYIKEMLNGFLEDQTNKERSKFIDFYLDYTSDHKIDLNPFFRKIVSDITKNEFEIGKRKNRRSNDTQRRFIASVRILVLNLIHTNKLKKFLGDNLYLAVPFDRNYFGLKDHKKYSPPDITYDPYKDAFDGLIALDLLNVHRKGLHDPVRENFYLTRIEATPKLISDFDNHLNGREIKICRPKKAVAEECIILRDENKRLTNYDDTGFTRKARSNLKKINKFISKHEYSIELPDGILKDAVVDGTQYSIDKHYFDTESVYLRRIFNDGKFNHGGRFYGGWWQSIRSGYRRYIRINGQETVEWDYSRCHITMLYAELGIPMMEDPYKIHPKVSADTTKIAINTLLNASGFPKQMTDYNEAEAGLSWVEFIDQIKNVHHQIADYLMVGHGIILQYKESEITEEILIKLMDNNIPCLPIHDSFITTKEYSDILNVTMCSVFKDKFGIDINIKLKE